MRFVKTITVEINDKGRTIGEIWGISPQRAEEIHEKVTEWAKETGSWSELYKRIFSELKGNEAIYAFGYANYVMGRADEESRWLEMMATSVGGGRKEA